MLKTMPVARSIDLSISGAEVAACIAHMNFGMLILKQTALYLCMLTCCFIQNPTSHTCLWEVYRKVVRTRDVKHGVDLHLNHSLHSVDNILGASHRMATGDDSALQITLCWTCTFDIVVVIPAQLPLLGSCH